MGLSSGVDISLWDQAFAHLEEAVEQGLVSQEAVDQAALRVLEQKFALGLFEHPYLDEKEPENFKVGDYPQSLELARQGAVLLKNEGLLPLQAKGKKIALIGPNAHELYNQLGDYTPQQPEGAGVTLLEGLQALLGEQIPYALGCPVCGADDSGIPQAVELAKESDLVILAVGGSSSRFAGAAFDTNGAAILDGPVQMDCGEGVDCSTLRLPGCQEELCRQVLATGTPVAAVVIAGRPYAIPQLAEKAQALVYSFYPGPWGGQALAEVLLGEVNPSGRLPASLPRSVGQLPCYYNSKSSYAALRYCDQEPSALFPFGYGLSYTSFQAGQVQFPQPLSRKALRAGERAQLRFTLGNTGDRPGWAVPQLYVHDVAASTVRRVKELKDFQKVCLQPGEEREVTLSLGWEDLALWNAAMERTVEPGEFTIFLEEGGKELARGTLTVLP